MPFSKDPHQKCYGKDTDMSFGYQLLWLMSVILGALAYAEKPEVVFGPIPTSVSGTFHPFSLAVDGKKLFRSPKILKKLTVNETEVSPEKQKLRPYFIQIQEDNLKIEAEYEDGESQSWNFSLPNLVMEAVTEKTIVFRTQGKVENVLVDGNKIPLQKEIATWQFPSAKNVFSKTRVVEASGGKEKPGRLYNLKVTFLRLPQVAPAKTTLTESVPWGEFIAFRLSQFSVFQSGGRNSFSGFLSWSPWVNLSSHFTVGASLGLSSLKAISGNRFFVTSFEGWVGGRSGNFGAELGAGLQNWGSNGGSRPLGSVTLQHFLDPKWGSILDRIFLTYSYFSSLPDSSHELRVGVGISF